MLVLDRKYFSLFDDFSCITFLTQIFLFDGTPKCNTHEGQKVASKGYQGDSLLCCYAKYAISFTIQWTSVGNDLFQSI